MVLENIIYDNLISLITNLTSNDEKFEDYYNGLGDEDQQTELLGISDEFDTELNSLRESKEASELHVDFDKTIELLNRFTDRFSNYPDQRTSEALVIIYLLNFLNEALDEAPNLLEDIDTTLFALVRLEKDIMQKNFAYHDPTDILNSIVLIDFSDPEELSLFFQDNPLPKELIIQLLAKIGADANPLSPGQYCLVRNAISAFPNQIWACAALHVVKNGRLIHTPYNYSLSPQVNPTRVIDSSVKYQQFNDSILILSEYNNQSDILDKYLRIYHLLENFMYKFPLADLERKYAGRAFSIRDFQRMNDVLNKTELKSLKLLMNKVGAENYTDHNLFSQYIHSEWNEIVNSNVIEEAKLNILLSELRINNTFASVDENAVCSFFANLIYAFRNALVHNRETEFHLTHETLLNHNQIENSAQLLLEKFIIPISEEIVFYLMTVQNQIVWFQNSTLTLFKEN